MKKEIKKDWTIKRVIKIDYDGQTAEVELSTGVVGTVDWDIVHNRPKPRAQ